MVRSTAFWKVGRTVDRMAHVIRDVGCVAERLLDSSRTTEQQADDRVILRSVLNDLWVIYEEMCGESPPARGEN